MTGVALLPKDALAGVSVAVSVSDSADLGRLGLRAEHANYAVSEIARAVLTSGGNLVYGGRVHPRGFTQLILDELVRYGGARQKLIVCLAAPEHRKLSLSFLDRLEDELVPSCRLEFLDDEGNPTDPRAGRGDDLVEPAIHDVAAAYSAMRRHVAAASHAQLVVGGQLAGFRGVMPGVVEETVAAAEAGHPIYVAGGFGGAAALVIRELGLADASWLPDDVPARPADERVRTATERLRVASRTRRDLFQAGLDPDDRELLAWSHRPGEIASLTALGLARTVGNTQAG